MSKRIASLLLMACCFLLAAKPYMKIQAVNTSKPITLYTAKEIVTMNPKQPYAKAVAVKAGKIIAVGSLSQVKESLASSKYELDNRFKDDVIVAGFISQHLHPFLSALILTCEIIAIDEWSLPGKTFKAVRTRKEYFERLTQADKQLKPKDTPLITWGYHQYFHGPLSRQDLDKINAERPIIVWHRSAHEFYLNTAALEKYQITRAFLAEQNKSVQAQADWDKGHFWEQSTFAILPKIALDLASPDRLHRGLKLTQNYMHYYGVTAASEPGGILSKSLQMAQNNVFGKLDSPFRFYFIPDGKGLAKLYLNNNLIKQTEEVLTWGQGYASIVPKQIKLFADGAIYSQAMKMLDGYTDGHHGEWMMDKDVFEQAFKKYWDAEYQIHIHVNGDKGLQRVLDNLEKNMRANPRKDHRTVIVHFGFSTPQQVKKIKQLGAIVSANPYYVMALADKYSKVGIGPKRANQMVRLGDVVRAGIPFSLHSDMPMAPEQPLFLMHNAVNRTTFSGRVAGELQRVSPLDALKGVTIEAAYSLRLEKKIGSIEVGKDANFTILAKNPLKVPEHQIKNIKVLATIHEGKLHPIKSQ